MKAMYIQWSRKKAEGFVLLSVLLVVSLLTVLIVTSVVIVQTEQRVAYNSSQMEVARQNALFGLNQALNQLQRTAGPDRRVTARADILNPTNSGLTYGYASSLPSNDSGQQFWTGVWRNSANDYSGSAGNGYVTNPDPAPGKSPGPGASFLYYDYTPDGKVNTSGKGAVLSPSTITSRSQLYNNQNVSWLVSWPSYAKSVYPDPTASLSSQLNGSTFPIATRTGTAQLGTTVTLAKLLNTNQATGSSSVLAPRVPLFSTAPGVGKIAVGSFAYWVSDEGIKAKTNMTDPFAGSSTVSSAQAHFQISQSCAANLGISLTGLFPTSGETDVRTIPSTAPTLSSMAYLDPTWSDLASEPNSYSTDFTVNSYGVIADSFNGGLRKDLTAALENNLLYQIQFGDASNYETCRKLFNFNNIAGKIVAPNLVLSSSPGQTDIIFDGMRWDSLYFYYNIYHTTMNSPLASQPAPFKYPGIGAQFGNECSGTTPTLTARLYQEPDPGTGQVAFVGGIMPTRAFWNYNVAIALHCISGNKYDLVFGEDPIMMYENPYDLSIVDPPGSSLEMSVGALSIPVTLTISDMGTLGDAGTTGQFYLPTPDIQISPDATPFAPGEIRAYGLQSNIVAAPVTSNLTSLTTQPFSTFKQAGTNTLVSPGMTPQSYQESEWTGISPFTLNEPSNDVLTFQASSQTFAEAGSPFSQFIRNKFTLWPANAASTGNIVAGFFTNHVTANSTSGVATVVEPRGSIPSVSKPLPIPLDNPSNLTIVSMEDHLPGINCPGFCNQVTTSQTFNNPMGLPFFAAGGSMINPFNIECNGAIRDFKGSALSTGGAINSDNDLQFIPPSLPSSPTKSVWLPGSVGETSSSQTNPLFFDLPRQPLLSLGQFKNMSCGYSTNGNGIYDFSFHPLGGSYLSCLPPNDTFAYLTGNSTTVQHQSPNWLDVSDDNFLNNEVLFDGYFLSTVPPANVPDPANWQIPNANAFKQTTIDANSSLPNARLTYYRRSQALLNGNPPSTGSNSPNIADLQPANTSPGSYSASSRILRKPAANLLINGAFNINSTSVPAWTALLTSTYANSNNNLTLFASTQTPTYSSHSFSSAESPFLNFSLAYGPFSWVSQGGQADNNLGYFGMVDMKTSTIAKLATAIVTQVKARGPFLSLGDFLNHRLDTSNTNALSVSGALQSAIDSIAYNDPVTSINGQASSSAIVDPGEASRFTPTYITSTLPGFTSTILPTTPAATATGIPGTLTQGDLVQLIAPVIASRSDTFTIRAYGQAIDPIGTSDAEAYCEVVVQRLPEYEYSTENDILDHNGQANYAYDDPSPSTTNVETIAGSTVNITGLTPANSTFGRRFTIISFRWLNQNEL